MNESKRKGPVVLAGHDVNLLIHALACAAISGSYQWRQNTCWDSHWSRMSVLVDYLLQTCKKYLSNV